MIGRFGLSAGMIEKICAAAGAFPTVEKLVVYGSRARGDYKNGSDIDIAVFGQYLAARDFMLLSSIIDDLSGVFKADVVHFDVLENEALKKTILSEGVVISSCPRR